MNIKKYFSETDADKVLYDLQGLTPRTFAAVVAGLELISQDNKHDLSTNADAVLMKLRKYEDANVNAIKKQ